MATKSSLKTTKIPSKTQTRVPLKWRNLPPAGIGVTSTMKARPIIEHDINDFGDTGGYNHIVVLMPLPMCDFTEEIARISALGYSSHISELGDGVCPKCGHEKLVYFGYAKRHRNGKPNYDWTRDFNVCPNCLHVGEFLLMTDEEYEGHKHLIQPQDTGAA